MYQNHYSLFYVIGLNCASRPQPRGGTLIIFPKLVLNIKTSNCQIFWLMHFARRQNFKVINDQIADLCAFVVWLDKFKKCVKIFTAEPLQTEDSGKVFNRFLFAGFFRARFEFTVPQERKLPSDSSDYEGYGFKCKTATT